MKEYDELRKLVDEMADDVAKVDAGVKAAGTRVRKALQRVKATAQLARAAVMALTSPKK